MSNHMSAAALIVSCYLLPTAYLPLEHLTTLIRSITVRQLLVTQFFWPSPSGSAPAGIFPLSSACKYCLTTVSPSFYCSSATERLRSRRDGWQAFSGLCSLLPLSSPPGSHRKRFSLHCLY